MDEPYLITIQYGYVELRSWIEFDGDKFIGMGSKIAYDEKGNITEAKIEPTGLIGYYA